MYITVEDALKLPALTKAALLAGKGGLQGKIVAVNVMEVPDISDYVKPGELLITTMYPIRENAALKETLIPTLAKKGVAAIVIVPLTAEGEIPEFMLEQAHSCDFPLIKLPHGTSFNEILNPILEQILERKHIEIGYRSRAKIIGDVLEGKGASKSQLLSLEKFYGWKGFPSFVPVVMDAGAVRHEGNGLGNTGLLLQDFSRLAKRHGVAGTIVADFDEGFLFLFPKSEAAELSSGKLDKTAVKINTTIKQLAKDFPSSCFGIGRSISGILQLPAGFLQAKQACETAKRFESLGRVVEFDQLGIYRVLFDTSDSAQNQQNKHDFVEEKLGALIEADTANNTQLLRTLRTLLEENGSLKQAAKAMFVHHNTMRYRLDQIERLTGSDFSKLEVKLEFLLALKMIDLLAL